MKKMRKNKDVTLRLLSELVDFWIDMHKNSGDPNIEKRRRKIEDAELYIEKCLR